MENAGKTTGRRGLNVIRDFGFREIVNKSDSCKDVVFGCLRI